MKIPEIKFVAPNSLQPRGQPTVSDSGSKSFHVLLPALRAASKADERFLVIIFHVRTWKHKTSGYSAIMYLDNYKL